MADSWDELCRTCMHGVHEGIDDHRCPECQNLAKKIGMKPNPTGWFFGKKPTKKREEELRKEYGI